MSLHNSELSVLVGWYRLRVYELNIFHLLENMMLHSQIWHINLYFLTQADNSVILALQNRDSIDQRMFRFCHFPLSLMELFIPLLSIILANTVTCSTLYIHYICELYDIGFLYIVKQSFNVWNALRIDCMHNLWIKH